MSLPSVAFFVKAFAASVMFISLTFSVFMIGPTIETVYYPVMGQTELTGIEPAPNNTAVVYGVVRKQRDCVYLGMAWYRGRRDATFLRVDWALARKITDESIINRPPGTQAAGPWTIGIPADEIVTNSFADIYHICHPFWTTRSRFWN